METSPPPNSSSISTLPYNPETSYYFCYNSPSLLLATYPISCHKVKNGIFFVEVTTNLSEKLSNDKIRLRWGGVGWWLKVRFITWGEGFAIVWRGWGWIGVSEGTGFWLGFCWIRIIFSWVCASICKGFMCWLVGLLKMCISGIIGASLFSSKEL